MTVSLLEAEKRIRKAASYTGLNKGLNQQLQDTNQLVPYPTVFEGKMVCTVEL